MTDLFRALQSLILTAADTMHVWRDAAVVLLAGFVIVVLWVIAGGRPSA